MGERAFAMAVRTARLWRIDTRADLLADLELDAGHPRQAANTARTGLTADVAAEQLWRALMRAEHALGNLAGVHDAWRACRDAIADISLDGQPHPATTRLYEQFAGRHRHRRGEGRPVAIRPVA